MAVVIPPNQRPETVSPLETPSFGSGGHHSIICSTTIHAALPVILTALLDTRTYGSWNRFCRRVTVDQQPSSSPSPPAFIDPAISDLPTTLRLGTAFTFDVHLSEAAATRNTTAELEVSVLEEFRRDDGRQGVRVAWRTASRWTPGFVLRSERIQELVQGDKDGETEYRCWETFYGLLASSIRMFVGQSLEWGFGTWMDGLKEFAEKAAR